LHFCSLRTDVDLPVMTGYMTELAELLAKPPASIDVRVHALEEVDIAVISRLESLTILDDIAEEVTGHLGPKYGHVRTVILSNEDHPFAIAALRAKPNAIWGCACGCVAFVYGSSEKHVVWHEALHLLGATDCYDTDRPELNPGPICEVPNCIMQYVPDPVAVGRWPFLCERNLRFVRARTLVS
ncbi:MAG TPA: hypothetical protein VGF55_16265, partial [Gemmataceae bacterium]